MNANAIINDEMSLDDKLAAIDAALASATTTITRDGKSFTIAADPADLTICEGCS